MIISVYGYTIFELSNLSKYLFLLTLFSIISTTFSQTVSITETDGFSKRLRFAGTVDFSSGNTNDPNLTIDLNTKYQYVDGFGYSLTQGSAKAIRSLRDDIEDQLLNELFNPNSGNAISVVRISIGASDLSEASYSYSSFEDTNLNNFAIDFRDVRDLIPVLQRILQINPNIKILATPWSAPIWMKDGAGSLSQDEKNIFLSNKYRSGRLQPRYYGVYANYFVKYIQAMGSYGIPIWAITPQNEPENPFNEPSMKMTQDEQFTFVDSHLGPTLNNAGYGGIKIIGFDHNCDNTNFPSRVAQSTHVDGSAFHLYEGIIDNMSVVRSATGKGVYFTEQFTEVGGSFDGDFGYHMENVLIGSLSNWSKTVLEWNLATDSNFGPRTNGGCRDCLGAITVNNSTSFTRNVSYYIIAQASRFIDPGARRIKTSGFFEESAAFENPDGTKVLLVYNKFGGNYNMRVNVGNRNFAYSIPPRTAVTFKWENWNGNNNTSYCSAPGATLTSKTTTSANLAWNNVGANYYYIYARNTNGGSWYLAANGINSTSYNVTGLSPGNTYEFHVYASCPNNTSPRSELFATTNSSSNGGGNGTIISQGKPFNVSSTWSAGFEGWRANDGNINSSRWASSSTGQEQWIYYDLGAHYNINNVVTRWESAYSNDFSIHRWDGSGWSYINGLSNNSNLTNNISTPTTARYILLYSTRAPYNHISLYEFEIYGSYAYAKTSNKKETTPSEPDFGNKTNSDLKLTGIDIYPNPAKDLINIKLKGIKKGTLVISDILGKIVYKNDIRNEVITLNKGNIFKTGVYIVKAIDENNKVHNSKLIIN